MGCKNCQGTGTMWISPRDVELALDCPRCDGSGQEADLSALEAENKKLREALLSIYNCRETWMDLFDDQRELIEAALKDNGEKE